MHLPTPAVLKAFLSLRTILTQCTGKTSGGSTGCHDGPYVSIGSTKNETIRMKTILMPGENHHTPRVKIFFVA
jgi:hypothetical protein